MTLKNRHVEQHVLIKIKATQRDLYEVHPSICCLKPSETINVKFTIKKKISSAELEANHKNDQFLIEMANFSNLLEGKKEINDKLKEILQKK